VGHSEGKPSILTIKEDLEEIWLYTIKELNIPSDKII
jgi:hypothetical protein